VISQRLPETLEGLYSEQQQAIRQRLAEFAAVPEEQWFYELCFCLCTPQSSAVHAFAVQKELQSLDFLREGQDVLHVLRDPACYIRFHNTKHDRLHAAREHWSELHAMIAAQSMSIYELRNQLAERVNGFGLKEASHFLRNIGRRGLAIIDRHLLTNLVRCGVYQDTPSVSTASKYHTVERAFQSYCHEIGINMDEVDLLFWCAQTGHILK
jgi:N-glycosylase/DNA lyase